nr:unnamed protein product [Callosobruchus analis]
MTNREKRQCRKSWRERSRKYYQKKCDAKKASIDFMRANTPSSLSGEASNRYSPTPEVELPQSLVTQGLPVNQSTRLCAAKKESIIQRRRRNRELK